MTQRGTKNPLVGRVTALVLDYGTDAESCTEGMVEISELGMLVRTRWQFTMGTELSVVLACTDAEGPTSRFTVQGIVVWCEKWRGGEGKYESTVLFWEVPAQLKRCLQER